MDTLTETNINLFTIFIVTILFNYFSIILLKSVKSNAILCIWYGLSIAIGFIALFIVISMLLYVNSNSITINTSGIIFIWYSSCALIFLQIVTFLTGYVTEICHSNCLPTHRLVNQSNDIFNDLEEIPRINKALIIRTISLCLIFSVFFIVIWIASYLTMSNWI